MARTAILQRSGVLFHVAHPDAGDVQSGYSDNGDPWVSGPIMATGILPPPVGFTFPAHGAMVDPDPTNRGQGYDADPNQGAWTQFYRPELNAAVPIRAGRPLRLLPGQRLVATESMPAGVLLPRTKRAAVLTVLSRPPAPGAFRPPYAGLKPARTFLRSEMRLDLLPSAVAELEPSVADAEKLLQNIWIDHAQSWVVEYMHPAESMPAYGRDLCAVVADCVLALCSSVPAAQKAELAARVCQLGIDNYAIARAGGTWWAPGGHSHGRRLPIMIAGLLLGDDDMLRLRNVVPRGTFGEDTQPYFLPNGTPAWSMDGREPAVENWDDSPYRFCCTANAWVGEAAAVRMLGLDLLWPGAWLPYVSRYLAFCRANNKPSWQRAWHIDHEEAWSEIALDDMPGVVAVGKANGPRLRLTVPPHEGGIVTVELTGNDPGRTCWLVGGQGREVPATDPGLNGVSLVQDDGAATVVAQTDSNGDARWTVPVTLPAGSMLTLQAACESSVGVGMSVTNALRVKVLPAEGL